ncbi:MAG: hypothetical protein HQK55_17820, partial [Deltaproteobacteria bacterium]|nr:hypothetical protein [Deltaproteobacteria bacterium]
LTTQLSSYCKISTYQNDNGQVCIQLSNGTPLVEGTKTWSLSTKTNSSTGSLDVTWDDGTGNLSTVSDAVTGGSIGGCLAARETIGGYLSDLNSAAATIIEKVNSLQTTGYDLNGDAG